MKKFFKQFVFVFSLCFILTLPFLAFAQISNTSIQNKMSNVGKSAGFSQATEKSLAETIGKIINTVLSLLGVVFVVLMIFGGYQWMTAGGNEEDVTKAQTRIKNAVIGLIIVTSSWAIWRFVYQYFIGANLFS